MHETTMLTHPTLRNEATEMQEDAPDNVKPLFLGDMGQLPLDTRRVLIHLLRGPGLDAQKHSALWPILLRDEVVIRIRLSELFLELVLAPELEVAFTRQADTGELEAPILLKRKPLTLMDSLVAVHLRQVLTRADSHGERAVISMVEIIDALKLWKRDNNNDHAGFETKVSRSISKLVEYSILSKMRGSEERYEISPTLKLIFSIEEIQKLTQIYQEVNDPDNESTTINDDAEGEFIKL